MIEKTQCPFCREKVSSDSVVVVSKTDEKTYVLPTKKEAFERTLQKIRERSSKSKILVFTGSSGNRIVSDVLREKHIRYGQVTGTPDSVKNMVRSFAVASADHHWPLNCVFLTPTFFGAGVNLENATDVILYDNLPTEQTLQAIGRAQRPGRKEPLHIWRLACENEMSKLANIDRIIR